VTDDGEAAHKEVAGRDLRERLERASPVLGELERAASKRGGRTVSLARSVPVLTTLVSTSTVTSPLADLRYLDADELREPGSAPPDCVFPAPGSEPAATTTLHRFASRIMAEEGPSFPNPMLAC
jgi:hypothetical protein